MFLKNVSMLFFGHKLKVSEVQCCFEPHWISLCEQKQLKHSSKYFFQYLQKKTITETLVNDFDFWMNYSTHLTEIKFSHLSDYVIEQLCKNQVYYS